MLNRLVRNRSAIEKAGHQLRFSVSRGPLNIASFLMGTTELLTTMMMDPQATHRLLRIITDFLKRWHALQRETIDSIDGIMLLDDLVGFIGEEDFLEFAYPYLKELYEVPVSVKLFHNDADCRASVKYYADMGVNLYNPGIYLSLSELREMTQDHLPILGLIPPRDVLAAGTPEQVKSEVRKLKEEAHGFSRLVFSCGGGMPPGVRTENIRAFLEGLT
jgi:uroporphyrinogen decarboxylase